MKRNEFLHKHNLLVGGTKDVIEFPLDSGRYFLLSQLLSQPRVQAEILAQQNYVKYLRTLPPEPDTGDVTLLQVAEALACNHKDSIAALLTIAQIFGS